MHGGRAKASPVARMGAPYQGGHGAGLAVDRRVRTFLHAAVLVVSSLAATPALAETSYELPSPLTVDAVVHAASAHRSEIAAASARARAAAQRPRIDSALPDPMVMASLDHLPFSLMGADFSLAVEQQFPLSSVLSRRKRAAEAGARREASDAARVTLDVELDAVSAYYMLLERRRTLDVLDEIEKTSRQLSAVAAVHYAAAHGTQADALRAESEVLRVASESSALTNETRAAEAMLNAALGRAPGLAIPEVLPPSLDRPVPPLEAALSIALANRPELAGMRHERERALAEVDVMRSMYSPMAVVRAGPSYTMAEGAGVMFMFGVSVPIWRDRLNAGVDEANAMVQMTNADIWAMQNMIRGEVATAREQVEAERTRLRALRELVRPKTEQSVEASLASYTATQTNAVTVIEALRALWDVREEEVMAEERLGLAWARLDRALGELGRPQRRKP